MPVYQQRFVVISLFESILKAQALEMVLSALKITPS